MIETIIFFYGAAVYMSVLVNLISSKKYAKDLGFLMMFIITPFILIYRALNIIFRRFDKYFFVDIVSFLLFASLSIWMTLQIHLMLLDNRIADQIITGFLITLIVFSLVHKTFQVRKEYDGKNIYRQPVFQQESQK